MKVHIDTDIGGDIDDACAISMLLGWPGVEITGITTTMDRLGRRAAMAEELLFTAGIKSIPVISGAAFSMTTGESPSPMDNDAAYWGKNISPKLSHEGEALSLLEKSINAGATIIAIGGFTNLAMLEIAKPGILSKTGVVAMNGCFKHPAAGLPEWGPEMDWNSQVDTKAAEIVSKTANLTLTTLEATLTSYLCDSDLPRLRRSGNPGKLLARQAEAYRDEMKMSHLAKKYPTLPGDLINFQYDAVTCAAAVGWAGIKTVDVKLGTRKEGEILKFYQAEDGKPAKIVADIDGKYFRETWLKSIESLQLKEK